MGGADLAEGQVETVGEEARQEIGDADRAFGEAIARGDVEGAARNVYTQDATILPPGAEMIRGRDNIVAFWRDAAAQLGLEKAELTTVELVAAGAFIHEVGRAVLILRGQAVEGKYTVLRKQEGGRWKWHVDCWNMNA